MADDVQPESRGEVDPVLVVTDDLPSAQRRGLLQPTAEALGQRVAAPAGILLALEKGVELARLREPGQRLAAQQIHELAPEQPAVQPVFQGFLVGLVDLAVRGVDLSQTCQNVSGNGHHVQRVGVDVRVAVDVNVALGTGERRRDVQHLDSGPGGHIAPCALQNTRVARGVQQGRDPELEIESRGDEQVRVPQQHGVRGPRPDEVRVLVPASNGVHVDVFSADLLGDPRVVR